MVISAKRKVCFKVYLFIYCPLCICMCVLECIFEHHMLAGALTGQKRPLDFLCLELQAAVEVLGAKSGSSSGWYVLLSAEPSLQPPGCVSGSYKRIILYPQHFEETMEWTGRNF